VYRFFGFKVAYVDDFIIHKKLRGQWHAKKIFETAEQEIREKKCDYLLLFSDNKRKASHKFYKKMWLTIIGLWVGIIAFKKINNQK
jgi:GNAT superfamily N-acetyltransferase